MLHGACRSGGHENLEGTTVAVGSPAYIQLSPTFQSDLYFVTCREVSGEEAQLSPKSGFPGGRSAVPPFPGLTLGSLVGKGGFGAVYRGIWDGRAVAVKVCLILPRSQKREELMGFAVLAKPDRELNPSLMGRARTC